MYWGLVFPMGMYPVCTFQLAKAMELEFLLLIPKFFIFIALIAWFSAIFGLIYHLTNTFLKTPTVRQPNHKLESV